MDEHDVNGRGGVLMLTLATALAFVGCAPGAGARPSLNPALVGPVVGRSYDAGGMTIATALQAGAAVAPSDAYAVCISGGGDCPAGQPDSAELASVTDDQNGQLDGSGSGSVNHTIHARLSWVFVWKGIACPPRIGGQLDGQAIVVATCDWLVIVDATSGNYLLTYAGPPIP
ncbi:MAG TPA: hypothetical protein VGQ85_00810 [Candidatus Limnocylindrales bacterium]|nr:hypothetical protein [Candidatus Limnocylindrales bacterium]